MIEIKKENEVNSKDARIQYHQDMMSEVVEKLENKIIRRVEGSRLEEQDIGFNDGIRRSVGIIKSLSTKE